MTKKIVAIVIAAIVFLALSVMLFFVATGYFSSIKMLMLDLDKVKTEYYIGEEFTSAGLGVEGKKGDMYYSTITDFVVDSSQFDSSKPGEYTIQVKHKDIKTSYNVAVLANETVYTRLYNDFVKTENLKRITTFLTYKNDNLYSRWIGNNGYFDDSTIGIRNESWIFGTTKYNYKVENDEITATESTYLIENHDSQLTLTQNQYRHEISNLKKKIDSGEITIEKFEIKAGDYYFSAKSGEDNIEIIFNLSNKTLSWKQISQSTEIFRIETNQNCTIPPMPSGVEWNQI